jgi:predicted O-methyltransferase YrrM
MINFSANLKNNSNLLKSFIRQDVNLILEVGSHYGGSTCIWLKNFLSDNGHIICVDPFMVSDPLPLGFSSINEDKKIEELFWNNVDAAKKPEQTVELRKNRSYQELSKMITTHSEKFDLIYIDGHHSSHAVMTDACLSFGLLRPQGILLFDDYFFNDSIDINGNPMTLIDRPKMAIDFFSLLFGVHIEILFINEQYAIRKW